MPELLELAGERSVIQHAKAAWNDHPCEMYLDHGSARPCMTEGHHWLPVFLQNQLYGRIINGELVWLCGTCHDNTHAWLYYLLGRWVEPRPHPPVRAKALAQKAFDFYRAAGGAESRDKLRQPDPRLF